MVRHAGFVLLAIGWLPVSLLAECHPGTETAAWTEHDRQAAVIASFSPPGPGPGKTHPLRLPRVSSGFGQNSSSDGIHVACPANRLFSRSIYEVASRPHDLLRVGRFAFRNASRPRAPCAL
jgi:hypothetical protein